MMKKTILLLLLCLSIHTSCKNQPEESTQALETKEELYDPCMDAVKELILSSNYKQALMSDMAIEDISKPIITIRIIHTNESGEQHAVGWLELDTELEQLSDMTNDPEHPVKLHFKKSYLKKVKQLC